MNPLARDPANQVGEFCRTIVTSVFQLTIERGVSSLVADVSDFTFQESDLRVPRVGSSEDIAPISNWNSFWRKIGDEIWSKACRDVPLGGFVDRIPENLFPLSTGRRRRRRKKTVKVASECLPISFPEIDK